MQRPTIWVFRGSRQKENEGAIVSNAEAHGTDSVGVLRMRNR